MESHLTDRKPPRTACQADGTAVAELLGKVGSKWTIFVMMKLDHGPKRFSELERMIAGISQKVLASTLRELEKDGLVTRYLTPTVPPRVDYELTSLGQGLCAGLYIVGDWAVANRDAMLAAREDYARREAENRAAVAW